jgi:hypothetical protein
MDRQMLKKIIGILILVLLFLISAILTYADGLSQTSFKGIELNSWKPATGVWHFSLLMGTNRTKTIIEITDPNVTIVGVENLKKELSELPKGENVFWLNYAKEPVPKQMVKDISDYSKSIGINLHILNP